MLSKPKSALTTEQSSLGILLTYAHEVEVRHVEVFTANRTLQLDIDMVSMTRPTAIPPDELFQVARATLHTTVLIRQK